MAARVIEAEARIKGTDLTGPMFASIKQKLDAMGKAQNAAAKVNTTAMRGQVEALGRFDTALRSAQQTAGQIAGFRALHNEMIASRQAFRAAEANVRAAAAAISDSGAKSSVAAAQYRQAQRSVSAAAQGYRDKAEAVKAAKAELAAYGVTLGSLPKAERNARQLLGQRQAQGAPTASPIPGPLPATASPRALQDAASKETTGAGLIYTLPIVGALLKGGMDAVTAGARVDSERARMRSAGWNEAEIGTAEHRANRFAAQFGTSPASSMGIIREARTVFGGDLQQTLRGVPDFFALRTAMKQGSPQASDEDLDRQMGQVIKAAEIGGYSKDPGRLTQFADFMTKMSQVHGSTLRGEEIVNFFKSAKTAGSSSDFEFLKNVLPTLLPEQSGDRLGTAAMTFRQAMVGGKMKHIAAKNLAELGLIDDKFVERDEAGDIKGVKRGGLKGQKLAETNPLEWAKQYLIPAMDAKGISPEDRSATVSSLFTDRNAEYFVSTLVNNIERLMKDRDAVEKAKGLKGAEETLRDDPRVAAGRLKAGLENVGASLTDPFMALGKGVMNVASNLLGIVASANRGELIQPSKNFLARDSMGLVDMQARLAEIKGKIDSIEARTHPSRRDAPNVELDALRGQMQDLQNRIGASVRAMPWADAAGALGERGRGVVQNPAGMIQAIVKPDQITAEVRQPIPLDPVKLDPASKVAVGVTVTVNGPGSVSGMSVSSAGNAKGSVGTSSAE